MVHKLSQGSVICDSEIYNFDYLSWKYDLHASNDPELFSKLISLKGAKALDEVDGVYSLAYFGDGFVLLARDILGLKPIFYSCDKGFAFSFIRNDLERLGHKDVQELDPIKILRYDQDRCKFSFINKSFFSLSPETRDLEGVIVKNLSGLFKEAVKKRVKKKKFGILFSGGVDSTLIALVCKKLGCSFTCYTSYFSYQGVQESEDLVWAKKVAKSLNLKLKTLKVDLRKTELIVKKLVPFIGADAVKIGVALPEFAACEAAKKDGCDFVFSGLGSEELYAGYQRHKLSSNVNKECLAGLRMIYERDTYRDYIVADQNHVKIETPFLDNNLVSYSLRIPSRFKLKDGVEKFIIRQVAMKIGVPKGFALRKKKAAQYGSNSDKALSKLARLNGFKYKKDYLNSLLS
jgi:asparagine synthetase B (glutamine-hydrolysing)